MPTYEYECKSCGHNFETFQAITDEPVKTCPKCGGDVRRLIFGGTGVIFKGSGFYVTDKNKGSSVAAAKDSKPAKPESKPAKPEAKPAAEQSPAPSAPAADSAVKKTGEEKAKTA